ncbi:MAG: hypothetical protein QME12_07765 [Nanoarchaeota archaeon]|nr:hypothetical protein [Nanoarchaeota archaeon]
MENKYEAVPFTEGIVESSEGSVLHHWRYGQFSLELKIDSFEAPVVVPTAFNLRIDVGEKVRLYASQGFKRKCTGCGGPIEIDGLEVLGENGKVLFRYISSHSVRDAKFMEEA